MSKVFDVSDVEDLVPRKRDELLRELQKIDPEVVLKVTVEKKDHVLGHFSDWNDKFNDGVRFADTFGKAGG